MNLVFLINLNEDLGGGGYSIYKFAEALANRGNNVSIFYVSNKEFIKSDIYNV